MNANTIAQQFSERVGIRIILRPSSEPSIIIGAPERPTLERVLQVRVPYQGRLCWVDVPIFSPTNTVPPMPLEQTARLYQAIMDEQNATASKSAAPAAPS